jgi:hypothetical protein
MNRATSENAVEREWPVCAVLLTAKQGFETSRRGVVIVGGHGGLSVDVWGGVVWGEIGPHSRPPSLVDLVSRNGEPCGSSIKDD